MLSSRTTARADAYAAEFAAARPFRYVVMDDFLDAGFAARLLEQFPAFESGNARTEHGTLGNKSTVERIRALGPDYAVLDDLVQSAAFLALVGHITGIPTLLYDPWYFGGGTHENRNTQDLDAHIDFNRHPVRGWDRRLNLIVYLNREWDDAWGGSLELHSDPHSPDDSVTTITPLFNRAVVFETTEHSWHAFPAIRLPPEKASLTRKSIALYFYSQTRPAEEVADTHSTIYVDRPLPERFVPGRVLSDDDLQELRTLLVRRDQHVTRLYNEITTLTKQLEEAQTFARRRGYALPAPPFPGAAPAAPPQAPPFRALVQKLPESLKRPLRRLWYGADD
jgi:hypothetical protein